MPISLFLASGSPRRTQLLSQADIPHQLIENLLKTEALPALKNPSISTIRFHIRKLAEKKAKASSQNHHGWILGVDTVVVFKNKILGKPLTKAHAETILKQLSGNTHSVITAYCLFNPQTQKSLCRSVVSKVTFHKLTETQIKHYINTHNTLDKAGAYGIQDIGTAFVKTIQGSYTNIIGLPIESLKKTLKSLDN